ncbi:MAG: class I SAM-dependent methyltransferase, partial [Thermoplasmata archaeon]
MMAVAAQGFPAAVDAYVRARPGYPAETIHRLVAELGLRGTEPVLELAAGTGKFTAALLEAGAVPVAVEPLERFCAPLRRKFPRVPLVAALAEALPFAEARFESVMVAQAFHWFDAPRALSEIRRVLRPGGSLALVWNIRVESHPLHAEMSRLLEGVNPGVPGHRRRLWKKALERQAGYSPLSQLHGTFQYESTLEEVVDRVASVSFVATLPE